MSLILRTFDWHTVPGHFFLCDTFSLQIIISMNIRAHDQNERVEMWVMRCVSVRWAPIRWKIDKKNVSWSVMSKRWTRVFVPSLIPSGEYSKIKKEHDELTYEYKNVRKAYKYNWLLHQRSRSSQSIPNAADRMHRNTQSVKHTYRFDKVTVYIRVSVSPLVPLDIEKVVHAIRRRSSLSIYTKYTIILMLIYLKSHYLSIKFKFNPLIIHHKL